MTGKVYFILVSTFVMGMLSGAYLYISVFAPTYESDIENIGLVDEDRIVLEGQMYGGCQEMDSCASFRIADDRTFTYLEYPGAEVIKGKLPNELTDTVFASIGTSAFFAATEEIANNNCASYVDGIDAAYQVWFDGDEYTLDTCFTALAYDDFLQSRFSDVWVFLEDPQAEYPVLLEEGVGGFIIDRFQNSAQ